MRILFASLLLAFASCATPESSAPAASSSAGQSIVDRFAARYPEIARLSIHAVPAGESSSRIVASTVAGRIGEPSDPEDLRSMKTGEAITLQEGRNLDYTVPVQDPSGRTIAVVGITISGTSGTNNDQLARAKELSGLVAAEIRAHGKPLL